MKSNKELKCFKAYDVRGKLGKDLNEDIVYRIARATLTYLKVKNIVVGFDARQSPQIWQKWPLKRYVMQAQMLLKSV